MASLGSLTYTCNVALPSVTTVGGSTAVVLAVLVTWSPVEVTDVSVVVDILEYHDVCHDSKVRVIIRPTARSCKIFPYDWFPLQAYEFILCFYRYSKKGVQILHQTA